MSSVKHRCEGITKNNSQCKRNETTFTNNKWICKQHGGKGMQKSCIDCKKCISKYSEDVRCIFCKVGLLSRNILENIQQEKKSIDEDPSNCE